MLRQALNWLQQRVLQPATSAVGSRAVAVHTLLQDWKSLLQTRTLWLPGPQTLGVGASDCAGGIRLPDDWLWLPCVVVCASAAGWSNSNKKRTGNPRLIMSPRTGKQEPLWTLACCRIARATPEGYSIMAPWRPLASGRPTSIKAKKKPGGMETGLFFR
jgi:hypothetical protein